MSRDAPIPGVAEVLRPGLVRVLAPNPSPMTYHGTNTYILGDDSLCIIDPGPDHPAHLAALLQIIAGRPVSHIIATHSHVDHSALAATLARTTKAPVLGFGDSSAGRSAVMQDLMQREPAKGGEGVDHDFSPDRTLPDGASVTGADWQLRVIHTPGHFGNHICLRWGDAIFSGDHVMGWASSMVSPPEGDLTDFMTSCRILRAEAARILYPGHGDPITDPTARIDWLLAHRAAREAQILAALDHAPQTIATLTATLYTDTPPHLHPAAARNVFAHLIDLAGRDLVRAEPALQTTAWFCRK
jgi:glyoxylase-like metal-dependent hydrolase (beta-lactamase superfamily II)